MVPCLLLHPHPPSPSKGEEKLSICGSLQSKPPACSSPSRGRVDGSEAPHTETCDEH